MQGTVNTLPDIARCLSLPMSGKTQAKSKPWPLSFCQTKEWIFSSSHKIAAKQF